MPSDSENPPVPDERELEQQEAKARIAKLSAELEGLKQQLSLSQQQTALMDERLQLDRQDIEARIAKTAVEKEVLADQLTRAFRLREWLKTLGAAAAIFVFLWTVISGLQQLKDSLTAREEERFERAIVRISGEKPTSRLTGVVSLRDFLASSQHASTAMSYLANAMILEPDSTVRRAILEALTSLKTADLDPKTLNQTIETLVDGNRNLTRTAPRDGESLRSGYSQHSEATNHLQSISRAIVFLLRHGAQIQDMSGIYCAACDFHGLQLAGVAFDDAVLTSAVFDNAVLTASSFNSAVLTRTSFIGAHLDSAKFTLNKDKYPGFAVEVFRTNQGEPPYGPDFNCADLENADFSGQPFFGFVQEAPGFIAPINAMIPELTNANLKKSDFTHMGVYLVLKMPKGTMPQPIRLPRGASPSDIPFLPHPLAPPPTFGIDTVMRLPFHFMLTGEAFQPQSQFDAGIVYGYIDDQFSAAKTMFDEEAWKMFKTSFFRAGLAFEHSNWKDARLPEFLRKVLDEQRIVTTAMNPPCTPNPDLVFR